MAIVIIRTLVIYFALVIFIRLMGKRQLGELELPELVIAVLIADLGAHPLQDIGIPLLNGLLPIIVLFCCEVLISGAAMKSVRLRGVMFGKPCFLIEKGRINQKEMRKNRFTLDELTEELRSKSITDLSVIEYAVLETDGSLSTVLFPAHRPATVSDLSLSADDKGYPVILINDGHVLQRNLKIAGRDAGWLSRELARRGVRDAAQVYLLSLDGAGNVYFAAKEGGA